MPDDVVATVDHISIAPSPGAGRLVITVTASIEVDDSTALDLTSSLVDALARMRGEGDPCPRS